MKYKILIHIVKYLDAGNGIIFQPREDFSILFYKEKILVLKFKSIFPYFVNLKTKTTIHELF